MKKICVIGSLNVDLTLRMPRFHAPGETITALSFSTYAGGKGGNQAVAAAKLGADVLMVGKLGDDQNGAFYQEVFKQNHIHTDGVQTVASISSGIALIEVDDKGENRIAIVPGTNALVNQKQVDDFMPLLLDYDIILLQLEIPMETVCYAAKVLSQKGKCIILDPAPAVPLPQELYGYVDYLTPNTTELSILSNMAVNSLDEAEAASRILLEKGAKNVVAKLGAKGCYFTNQNKAQVVKGYSVEVVDTTAAGDSFNAGLAVALAQDMPIEKALSFANAVGALAVTGAGAQGAMPTMEAVKAFIHKNS